MASNQDQYNQKNAELIANFEDLIKKAKSLIKLNDSDVGAAAGADSLDEIAVGNAAAVRAVLELGEAALRTVVGGSGSLMAAGAFGGFGGNPGAIPTEFNNDVNTAVYVFCAFYCNTSYANAPPGNGTLLNIPNSLNRIQQVYLRTNDQSSSSSYSMSRRYYFNGNWTPWITMRDTSNSTVDPNGYIKVSSPIFRLANEAADAVGDEFIADGCGAYNFEAKGVSAVHKDVGVYTVSGSLGFAAEGWEFEAPQDGNKNILCFVEADVADDGTITVRVFKKRFDYETAMIVAGDPMDIPDGRFISLRLEMPTREVADEPDAGEDESTEE